MGVLAGLRTAWTDDARVAVTWAGRGIRYGELLERCRKAAGAWASWGAVPGDVVGLQAERGVDQLALFLGAIGSGLTVLLLNDRYTAREVGFVLADSGARVAVVQDAVAQQLPDGVCRLVWASEASAGVDAAAAVAIDGDAGVDVPGEAVAALGYTSGTTGQPKGAVVRHRNIWATVQALHTAWGWRQDDVLVHVLPLFHIHGLFVAMLGALRADASVVLLERFTAEDVISAVSDHGGTVFMGVPTHYHRLLAHPAPRADALSTMRLWTSGSAPLPAAVWERFTEWSGGARILERYGMTEVGIVLSNPLDGERVPGTVGFPLPGVEAVVTHPETGAALPPDTVGELRISGGGVISHYLGLPDKTAAALVPDGAGKTWMRTGDLAACDACGRFRIVGRMGDMIITGGLNVYPREVEAVLLQHPAVSEVAVVGVPDEEWGEQVVALVVVAPGASLTEAEVVAAAREGVAGFKVPRAVRFGSELPRNAMGKVQKHRIRSGWTAL